MIKTNTIKSFPRNPADKDAQSKFRLFPDYSKVDWDKVDKIFTRDKQLILRRLENSDSHLVSAKDLLKLLATGAIFGISLAMPALPAAIAPFIVDRNKYRFRRFNQTVNSYYAQKLIEITYEGDAALVKITREGKMRALRYKLNEISIDKPKRWDGKWRMVIFDIPEKHKRMREIFRGHLKSMRFYPLQKSVWVHAYPCFNQIEFLRQIYHVGVNVTYVIADKMEDDRYLRSFFDLD